MAKDVASTFAPSWTTGTLIRIEHPGAQPPNGAIELLVEMLCDGDKQAVAAWRQ